MYRLIIADDEENIRNGMANSLPWREWGYEVAAVCASGQEVLDRMEDCRPDVVLSDIRMPGMDGVELMQRLSREYPQVKIVILSGYSDFKYLNMSIRSHVAEYLLKPTDIDDFEETFRRLKAAMDHERLRRAQITESVLRHFHVWLTAMLGGEDMGVLYSSGEEIAPGDVRADIEAIQRAVRDGLRVTLSAGVSDLCTEPGMLPQAYEQANCSAKQSAFAGQESGASRPWPPAAAATATPSKAWPCGCGNMWTPNTAPTPSRWRAWPPMSTRPRPTSPGCSKMSWAATSAITSPKSGCGWPPSCWPSPRAQYAITYTNNALFESYSRLVRQERIGAIYMPARREVLDFRDPNQVTTLLVKRFEALDVANPDKLGRFFFYPLQRNFLSTETYGEPRRDMVVLGSRRVYSALKSGYPYVHIFAIEEQDIYDLYQYQARRMGAAVYVLTEEGELISSTDEAAVAAGQAPAALLENAAALDAGTDIVTLNGERYNAAAAVCHSTDWKVLVLVPNRELMASALSLYVQILGVVLFCLAVFALLIWHFYRRFMDPLARLEQAMRQADAGDLKAYVKPQGPAEVVRMMEGYNAMLDSLRTGIEQQMAMQRRRQDLEMQVLMSQINPHFLYNTLESIVWKAGEAGRPDIGKLASSLGKLYRLSISGGLFVPLEQELEHVQMYMNIQRSRYGNKVDYEVRLHGVDPDQVEVLKLILQPIVENSLLYGMEGLDHTLRIRVAAWRRGEKLLLTVTDNGVGMDRAALARLRDQIVHGRKPRAEANYRSTGIGLHNIGARLRLYAGSSSCIRVQSKPQFGTRVTLELPWRAIGTES